MRLPALNSQDLFKKQQSGQALLIVLLAMAVVLTVVLSVVSRSVTDVTVTSYEEDALRAFSAAEAGVEEALLNGVVGDPPPKQVDPSDPTSAEYDVEVTTPSQSDNNFRYAEDLYSGETATFLLATKDASGQFDCGGGNACVKPAQIRICWGKDPQPGNVNERPAVEVSLYYDSTLGAVSTPNNYANVKMMRYGFDNYSGSRTVPNNFDDSGIGINSCEIDGTKFVYRSKTVLPPTDNNCDNTRGCLLMAKVRMLYNTSPQPVGIRVTGGGAGSLPSQGLIISSEGSAGESTRKINVFQSYGDAPTVFDAAVFSMQDIVKP